MAVQVNLPKKQNLTLKRLRKPEHFVPLLLGGSLVLVAILFTFFAPEIAPHHPNKIHLMHRLIPPAWVNGGTWQYPLGTDYLGRDVLSRIIYGAKISLEVGVISVTISLLLGVILGIMAGYLGRLWDDIIMRLVDIQLSFPFILMALTLMAISGPGLTKIVAVLALSGWGTYTRVIRSETISMKEREFVQAARSMGASDVRIMFRHLLPNVMNSVVVLGTLNVAINILLESGLTFLGLGLSPSIPSWGGMLANGREYIQTAWWISTFPGLAILLTVLGFNLLGDWFRDFLP